MIRIDEIYNNIFWPFLKKNVPQTRLFFCDPPGRSDPESLFNFGHDVDESNYVFLHDQEPIHLDVHTNLFEDVIRRNSDLNHGSGPTHSAIITSEWNSELVNYVCQLYGWHHYYYFFHGWAALDWYRGYDMTLLIPAPEQRTITKSFINPNRIIGGKRDHRVLLLYHLFKGQVSNALQSCPRVCIFENQSIESIAAPYLSTYPDIVDVFEKSPLPLHFPNENDHPMHSCWLSLWDECAQSLLYVVTETAYHGRRNHITEKTFKPICQRMPFVLVSTPHSLEYMRMYGFKTFESLWDESYDLEVDDLKRLEKISKLLLEIDALSPAELNQLYKASIPIIEHNFNHFYSGDFEKILNKELFNTLDEIKRDFATD
jgi:hypothetical protein